MTPLCRSDCNAWWQDCADSSFTCVRNWRKHFNWINNTNTCPPDTSCSRFRDIFSDAKDFCETVSSYILTIGISEGFLLDPGQHLEGNQRF